MKKHVLLGFILVSVLTISTIFVSYLVVAPAPLGSSSDDDGDVVATIPVDNTKAKGIEEEPAANGVILEIGDIICVSGNGSLADLIPGRYEHAQIYIGHGQVIEAHGVGEILGVHYGIPREGGDVYRVKTSSEIKQAAVDWTRSKVGLPYNYWLFDKRINGNSYYCSELIWAAYLTCGGPDIDQNPGWKWPYFNGVAPIELADDDDVVYLGTVEVPILEIGDIICYKGNGPLAALIPGIYDHAAIYIGGGLVVEAHPFFNADNGSTVYGIHYGDARQGGDVYRVKASPEIKQTAANWAETKLGLPYNFWLFDKRIDGNSYYCSELIWAAYLACGGPDIDQNPGWKWPYFNSVAPTEIADDDDTFYIGTIKEPTLKIGDLICIEAGGLPSLLIPGRYTHIQMYIGDGRVIESHIDGGGVRYTTPRKGGDVYRVKTSSEIKQSAVNWAESKLGLPYNYWLFDKRIDGNSYYCSELIWAAYLTCGGPDIDQNPGWKLPYYNGVAPAEIADDNDVVFLGTI